MIWLLLIGIAIQVLCIWSLYRQLLLADAVIREQADAIQRLTEACYAAGIMEVQ